MKKITNFELFYTSFFLSAVSFGGGYITIPILRTKYVEEKQLITEDTLQDLAAIAQSAPGAISVNLATGVGYKINGKAGGFASFIGTVLPPLFIISVITYSYDFFMGQPLIQAIFKGLEVGVAVIMVRLVIDMVKDLYQRDQKSAIMFYATGLILSLVFKIHIVFILILNFMFVYLLNRWELRHVSVD
ncbi:MULTISPECIES: chromate transporter [Erysipelothrix]|uniref:Chromate transporter n=1 Tax=Erysipelothrix piscisicarius TaxID=2485784 RepID=A0A3S5HK46_9FIRM|nr:MULTISPECIES: chromate transporter [Erysipelothrix]AZK43762.1 chromate transporter [Erysipelothrix piscisicarius]MBK2402113.1 chromate transporter [Erysipelothrix sp. strain 2 (EsS2-6-Brazil)]MBK2403875.1 chromate transporter [Erysipelothrix sp. strain 2 (EsS2-7-Brazil)]NBA01148.1 chromate transporter [Erysipelothrix rhusiopathiae]